MSKTRFTISWIYGEFRITRMQRGFSLERWTAPYPVHDLITLNKALLESCEHMDLSKGGDLTFAYEDDLHVHEFFDVPHMSKSDLNKFLQRKVEQNKPFKEKASWCYHEAVHSAEEEGIILHIMPKHIVDAIVRVCQEFYLTPKQLVPLSEIVTSVIQQYKSAADDLLIVVALFKQRVEILVTLGNGEVLFIRELPYSGISSDHQRLIIDINRTVRYVKQKYKKSSDKIWLIGEGSEILLNEIKPMIEGEIDFDPNGLDPFFWASEVSNIKGDTLANFIPILARKKLNRTLFYRVALWMGISLLTTSIITVGFVEYEVNKKHKETLELTESIISKKGEIDRIRTLISTSERGKQRLTLLKANDRNLPVLFVNHLGNLLPNGLTVKQLSIEQKNKYWQLIIKGESNFPLSSLSLSLEKFENLLTSTPWNITITSSWKKNWLKQFENGGESSNKDLSFEIVGEMQ